MNEKFIEIINDMADVLNAAQLKRLQEVLLKRLVKDEPEKIKEIEETVPETKD